MKPIADIRVMQYMEWTDDESGTKVLAPSSYIIQVQREGSDEWENVNIVFVKPEDEKR